MKNPLVAIGITIAVILIVLLLLPIICSPRDGGRPKSQSVLCQVGKLIVMHQIDHGAFPETLGALTNCLNLNPRVFATPWNQNVGSITNVDDWTDLIYVAGRKTNDPPDTVVAFYLPHQEKNGKTGSYVLCLDGSVDWRTEQEVRDIIKKLLSERKTAPTNHASATREPSG